MSNEYQPKTGQACSCKPGQQRDNCPQCEGTGMRIDFAAIRARKNETADKATARPFLIERLQSPEHSGDWHDKPLRWKVNGPEVQKFATKRDAKLWARFRSKMSFNEAMTTYLAQA